MKLKRVFKLKPVDKRRVEDQTAEDVICHFVDKHAVTVDNEPIFGKLSTLSSEPILGY